MSKTVLFVCTGNSCRSPMAEYLFRARAGEDWTAASAGLYALGGMPATPEAAAVMGELGIDLSPHRSRPVTAELVDAADRIVVMTASHRDELLRRFPAVATRTRLLGSFGTDGASTDVPDPIGASLPVYRKVRGQIESGVSDLILECIESPGDGREPRGKET